MAHKLQDVCETILPSNPTLVFQMVRSKLVDVCYREMYLVLSPATPNDCRRHPGPGVIDIDMTCREDAEVVEKILV